MKKLITVSLLMMFFALSASAQFVTIQITGTVTDAGNNSPVPNQAITIMSDSVWGPTYFYYNQVFTNSQGEYNDYVSVPSNMQILFFISTTDCNGNHLVQTGICTSPPIIANFSICTGPPTICDAHYSAVPDTGNPAGSLSLQFYDQSNGNPITWFWDLGDGTNSTLQNPYHTYAQAGTYYVCLTISTMAGLTCSICDTVYVGYNPPTCMADFVYVLDSNTSTGFYFFDLSVGNPTNWQWSFGDGTTSTLQNPYHIYNAQGTYQVCLTIWGNGCQSSYCDVVTVGSVFTCQALFYAYLDTSTTNYTYQFVDMSISFPNNPTSWYWDFGDNTFSTLQNPVHTYAQAGYYSVCLTIGNPSGCQSTNCDTLLVGPPAPCMNYFYFSTSGLNVNFYGYGYNGTPPYTFYWNFGDGATSAVQNPVHTYAVPGTYTVTLLTSDSQGCSYTTTQTVAVSNLVPGTIWGQVFANGASIDHGWAYLYIGNNLLNTVNMIDSTSIDSAGLYQFYLLNPLPGIYYVLAAPASNSVFYNTHLPTYYGNTPFWAMATPIYLQQPTNPYNITLIPAAGPLQGPGNIGGQVTNGNKVMQTGVPEAGVEVLLLDMNNDPLALDYSDNQGYFSFNNLALGTYQVYAEVAGLPTTPAVITLTSNNPAVNNIPVVITPNGIITDISGDSPVQLNLEKLYPNPANSSTFLELNLKQAATVEIAIFNLLGEKLQHSVMELAVGSHQLTLDLSDLVPGTYTLQLSSEQGMKKVKKITVIR